MGGLQLHKYYLCNAENVPAHSLKKVCGLDCTVDF